VSTSRAAPANLPGRAADAAGVRLALLSWYDRDHRDFPWRETSDPWAVLVSEVMLQQTQASRVAERFPHFLARFPTAADLAAAPAAAVLASWNGLGYNRRALALQRAAARIAAEGWPDDVEGLADLPGVGPYTARAVASLAFGTPVGVVDTNVRRWLIRRFASIDAPRSLQALADALAAGGGASGDGRAADWTHASMEFGAAICRARSPRCAVCPIARGCPSRDAAADVPVPAQPPIRGSDRAYRGAVVRALSGADGHAIAEPALRAGLAAGADRIGPALDDGRWERVMDGLERDGLAHRHGGLVRLGAATIGA
jgi:A/G-specific adenine glycosylase